jgi:AcrR family transcriptional regulator
MPRRSAPSRRRATSATTRDVILDAAGRRFAERGFAGVSVREIAADAGLKNQASLYHHFRDKRALYEAVIARGLEPILAITTQSQTAVPGSEGNFVEHMVDYLAAHPHLPRLIQRAALEDRRYLPSGVGKLLRPIYLEGVRVLADTSESGWEAADLLHLGAGLYLLIFGYFAMAPLIETVAGRDPLSPAAVARQRRFLRIALERLLGPAPAQRVDAPRRNGS